MESEATLHAVAANFNLNDSRAWLQFPFKGDSSLLSHPGSQIVLKDSHQPTLHSPVALQAQELALEDGLKAFLKQWRGESGLQVRLILSLRLMFKGVFSILVVSCLMWSGLLDSSDLPLSYPITSLA